MSLLPKIGRKDPKVRLGIALIYGMLIIGGLTMVYPFMITVTGAVSNDLDYYRFSCYPSYFFNDGERYLKYLAERYQGRFEFFKSAYKPADNYGVFREIQTDSESIKRNFPVYGMEDNQEQWSKAKKLTDDYNEFLKKGYSSRRQAENVVPLFLRLQVASYQDFLHKRYLEHGYKVKKLSDADLGSDEQEKLALDMIVKERGDYYSSFEDVTLGMYVNYAYHLPKWIPITNLRHLDFIDWIRTMPSEMKMPVTRQYLWYRFLNKKDLNAEKFNALPGIQEHGLSVGNISQVKYPTGNDIPDSLKGLRDEFNQVEWPIRLRKITVSAEKQQAFEQTLREQFATIEGLNKATGGAFTKWSDVKLSETIPVAASDIETFQLPIDKINAMSSAWRNFTGELKGNGVQQLCPETDWQDFLKQKYGSLAEINRVFNWNKQRFAQIDLPIVVSDYVYYAENKGSFFRQFVFYNFFRVFEFMALRGRALWNTLILVGLTIIATLTVNPLAAYALSRFRMKRSNQILVFLLATMAFPPEVAMIPSFLLLRDMHLLNTFGALMLPRLANGFSIFLLKGFFDSLPKELYEAASIDGASESRMFFTITLALSKPILAVLALNAFIASYSGFMWAFLVCQDSKMWTLMVWLFNYQSRMSEYPYMVMAALVLGSIPTLLVFMLCQKIILRGIIIPSMK